MGQSSELKELRKQIRNVAREIFPDIIEEELYARIERNLMEVLKKRLDAIDKRQAELTMYLMRNTGIPTHKSE